MHNIRQHVHARVISQCAFSSLCSVLSQCRLMLPLSRAGCECSVRVRVHVHVHVHVHVQFICISSSHACGRVSMCRINVCVCWYPRCPRLLLSFSYVAPCLPLPCTFSLCVDIVLLSVLCMSAVAWRCRCLMSLSLSLCPCVMVMSHVVVSLSLSYVLLYVSGMLCYVMCLLCYVPWICWRTTRLTDDTGCIIIIGTYIWEGIIDGSRSMSRSMCMGKMDSVDGNRFGSDRERNKDE